MSQVKNIVEPYMGFTPDSPAHAFGCSRHAPIPDFERIGGIKEIGPTKPILDMLEESKLIQVADDTVRIMGLPAQLPIRALSHPMNESSVLTDTIDNATSASQKVDQSFAEPEGARIPLPLGPRRLAFIQLPKDWQARELSKLIKILQIALEDDSEGTKN
jgi:hypothetical protein